MESLFHKERTHQIGEMATVGHSDSLNKNTANLNVGNITSAQMAEVKRFGQIPYRQSPKDTSSATPAESEAMKKWIAMKQNGFLTHPHGGKPMPEPQFGKKSRKRKTENRGMGIAMVEEEIGKKETVTNSHSNGMETEIEDNLPGDRKSEGVCAELHIENLENDSINVFPSSGLLDKIDTGIIRRIKECNEVQSTLDGVVQTENEKPNGQRIILDDAVQIKKEEPEGQEISNSIWHEETGGNEITRLMNYQKHLFQSFEQATSASGSENLESTGCHADYHEKLLQLLTAYSDIINRKCDSILSLEHEINNQLLSRISDTSKDL